MLAQASQDPDYFEIIRLIVDAAVPIILTFLGVRIFQLTYGIQQSEWLNQSDLPPVFGPHIMRVRCCLAAPPLP